MSKTEVKKIAEKDAEPVAQAVPTVSQKDLEEAALRRVCKAMNVEYETVLEKEKNAPKPEKMGEYDIGRNCVYINGVQFTGKGTAPQSQVEMIMSMAGNARMRKLREIIGEERVIEQVAGGSFSSRTIRSYGLEDAVGL